MISHHGFITPEQMHAEIEGDSFAFPMVFVQPGVCPACGELHELEQACARMKVLA